MSSLPLAALAEGKAFALDPRFLSGSVPDQTSAPGDACAVAWDEGFAAGTAQAQAQTDAEALAAGQAAACARIELALARCNTEQTEVLRQRLFAAVEALCEASLAPLRLDQDAFAARVHRAAAMLARADDERVLRLHPDDIALVADRLPERLEVRPDPTLERGALRLETDNGGVEDGPAHWRRAIAEALAQC